MATESNHITAAEHNFLVYAGDTWTVSLTFTDSNSAPIDLSAATLLLQIKKSKSAADPVLELSEGNGLTVGGAGSNVVTISTVANLPKGTYHYDLQSTFSASSITTYLRGTISVTEDVTR